MLLGADLGLLCSVVVVVVGWFVVRRKWRRVVARRQEIRRLLALASEEASRAELEAVATYNSYEDESVVMASGSSPERQFQYQCEVCFSPTTTRCKQCKAVHYCSGKCQIIHWRQGHKDECHSFTSHQNIDVGLRSYLTEFKQDETQNSGNLNGIEARHPTKPVEERGFPNPSLHLLSGKIDAKIENNDDGRETAKNVKASVHSLPDECSSSIILGDMSIASTSNLNESNQFDRPSTLTNVEAMKPLLSKQSIVTNPVLCVAASRVSNQLKVGCIDTDMQSESSTSSGSSAVGSEENSLSEPSTTSSDFWGATVEPIRSKIDALDEFSDVNMQSSRSCFPSSSRSNARIEVLGFDTNMVMADDPRSASMPNNSTDEAALLEKVNADCLKSRGPILTHIDVSNTSAECISKIKEAKSSLSSACLGHKASVSKGHASNKDVEEVSSLQYLAPKMPDNEIDHTSVISDTVECQENDYLTLKASEAHLSSSAYTRKHAILDMHSVENGDPLRVDAHSLKNSGYVQNVKSGINASARSVVDQLRASNFNRQSYLCSRSGIMGKYKGSFSYEHFVQLYNWNKVELRPCGLLNCGNSCYANVVLQCLAFTQPLTAYFLQGLHSKTCEKKEWCFTCELEALVRKAKEGTSPLSPAHVLSQMERIGSHLGNGREEDAHEFLRYAIDAMQFVCLKEAGFKTPSSLDEETTLVGLTFGGYLRSKIECMRCGGKSEQDERIMDLTVEIGGAIGTLEEALRQFTRSEILDGENKYHCGRCKSYEKAKKKLRVLDAPNVLTIALKRFQSGQYGKLNKAVKFPEILNLALYMNGTSDKSPIYQLYGVVVHLDAMNATFSGHYVCYIKNNQGRWFKADDSTVQIVKLEKVLLTGAYMLLYARCSPRAPRLIRSSMVPREPRKAKSQTCKSDSHPTEPWDVSVSELNGQTCNDCFYQHCTRCHLTGVNIEDDSSSENSSSFFSEDGSYSTESSNRESTSTDDSFDQILGDMGNHWNKSWRNSSDSDTSSQSSTPSPLHARHSPLSDLDRYSEISSQSSSPSPLHARHSPLSDLDRYSSVAKTSGSCFVNANSKVNADGFWARTSNKVAVSTDKGRGSFLCPDSHKEGKKLVGYSSSSCRENDSNRVGCNNSSDNAKGVYLRRSIQGRTD